jgi:nitrite reductase (NADH) small subunit
MTEFRRIARDGDIPVGEGRSFDLEDRQVAVFNIGGRLHAIDGRCAHLGGPLGDGEVDGRFVMCPWHSWTYDVTTGENVDHPECPVRSYEVKVEDGVIFVAVG